MVVLITVHILFSEGTDHAGGRITGMFSAGIGHTITNYCITGLLFSEGLTMHVAQILSFFFCRT